jgi:superfamily II DNA or RNA helicase
MGSADRFIASCNSWGDFWDSAKLLNASEKGIAFERLTQLYLQTAPEYRTELQNVWLLRDVPSDIRQGLNLPSPDEGIDLVAATRHGEYWAIQCKFRSQRDKPLTRRELGTFTSLAFNTCNNIALAVVAHTSSRPVGKRHLMRHTVEIGLDRFQSIDRNTWSQILDGITGRSTRPEPREPRPHQIAAVEAAKKHFIHDGETRGRLIMPCGTGKSLTAFWIADALKANQILVAVPSLALIRQSVADWTREFLARDKVPDWLCVCSDESVGNLERDDFVGEVYDLGLPTHTDQEKIVEFLQAPTTAPRIVFTTYQSSATLAAAARSAQLNFDLAILDEAHKTVGSHSKQFATLLSKEEIKVRHRLFMTATERVLRGRHDDVLSMDNEEDYGKRFFQLSFKEAIRQNIISDYKILTVVVDDSRVRELIEENRILDLNSRNLDEAEAQSLASGIALKAAFNKHPIRHAISFHKSIRAADRYREQQDALNLVRDMGPETRNFHISSKKTAGQRSDLLREFTGQARALMTNARCLTEGVDIPAIDCVAFVDPKQSRVDIVQAAGRALRRFPGKEYGYILLPLIVPAKMDFEEFAETTAFRQIASTITALSTEDERIADEFRAIERGRVSSGKIVEIEGDVPIGMKMELGDFAEAISTRIWDSVGRANWRDFEDARAFVSRLGLKARTEWDEYCASGKKPADIPSAPEHVYLRRGWAGLGDWLGTGRIAYFLYQYRPFKDARTYVRDLGLKSAVEWYKYCKSGRKPQDIPHHPSRAYLGDGWAGMGDWLGTGTIAASLRQYRSFKDARAFVRGLGLKSRGEWHKFCESKRRPSDIPSNPNQAYAKNGWVGMGDWLGTGTIYPGLRQYRPFKDARAFVHGLGLKSTTDWRVYCKSGKKPADVPADPARTYQTTGWAGMGDWLGTGRIADHLRKYRPFKEARDFVRGLNLKSKEEWFDYCKSGNKPADIPTIARETYADAGWAGFGDWLGTGSVASFLRQYRPFKEARTFVRGLGLKSSDQWRDYCKSSKKPVDIPAAPWKTYAENGWSGMGDWLGTGRRRQGGRAGWRNFDEARAFARRLGFNSVNEWRAYSQSGKLPTDVPAHPDSTYAEDGWSGWGDWLDTGRVATHLRKYKSFKEARSFARRLGLKSSREWFDYNKSGKRPDDIPSNPNNAYAESGWAGYPDWLGYASPPQG